jgi:hypothetical protein
MGVRAILEQPFSVSSRQELDLVYRPNPMTPTLCPSRGTWPAG